MGVLALTTTWGELAVWMGIARGGPHRFGFAVISILLAVTDPETTPCSFTPLFSVLRLFAAMTTFDTGPRSALTAAQQVSDGVVVTLSRISTPSMSPGLGAALPGPATPIANR